LRLSQKDETIEKLKAKLLEQQKKLHELVPAKNKANVKMKLGNTFDPYD
jgi:hypothetical protein